MDEKNVKRPNKSKILLATILPIGLVATIGLSIFAGYVYIAKRRIIWPVNTKFYSEGFVEKIAWNTDLNSTLKIKEEYKDLVTFPEEIQVIINDVELDKEKYIWNVTDEGRTASINIKAKYIKSNVELKIQMNIAGYRVIKGGEDANMWSDIPEAKKYAKIDETYEVVFEVSEAGKKAGIKGLPANKDKVTLKIGGYDRSPDTWEWKVEEEGNEEGYWAKAKLSLIVPKNYTGDIEIIIAKN